MNLRIEVELDYRFDEPTDVLLQIEAAALPEQAILDAHIDLPPTEHFARVPAGDAIGERIWLRVSGSFVARYRATVAVDRILTDFRTLHRVQPHLLPGETVHYLFPSCYCPAHRFEQFVRAEFAGLDGGALLGAMHDWIAAHISYVPGSSDALTTAEDSFIERRGICRDFAHLMITMARAAGFPARMASVYALGVEPPDFHAVAEVFVGGEWHLVDATGMADEGEMAKIVVGRDAADVAFLTAFGIAQMNAQSVRVSRA